MNVSDLISNKSFNVMQSPQDKLATQMKVDGVNAKIHKGKADNATTQKNEFLQILVTQLKNQNPLKPLSDKDFIAQMAQLSSVEKLEDLNKGIDKLSTINSNSSLFNLIGKRVSYVDKLGQENLGTIDSIDLKKGKGFLSVDGHPVGLDNILKIQQNLSTKTLTPKVEAKETKVVASK